MDWLRYFSANYADGVTAIVAVLAFALTALSLNAFRREYRAKYRPYLVPAVRADEIAFPQDEIGYRFTIHPTNVGPHPCWVRLSNVKLVLGDELITIDTMKDWSLIGTQGASTAFPSGEIYPLGVKRIRDHEYQLNRVEVHFTLHSKSIDDEHYTASPWLFEVDIRGDSPSVLYRPDLLKV
jgi:hypothetical protein